MTLDAVARQAESHMRLLNYVATQMKQDRMYPNGMAFLASRDQDSKGNRKGAGKHTVV